MKRLIASLFLVSILLGLVGFIFTVPLSIPASAPMVVMESLDETVLPYEYLWQREIGRRFPDAIGILVHGGDFVEGQWVVGTGWQPWKHVTPIEDIVTHFEHLYPNRTIVLVSCNPGHIHLRGHPHVYYALDSVWVYPDRAILEAIEAKDRLRTINGVIWDGLLNHKNETRWEAFPTVIGNIFEFVRAD